MTPKRFIAIALGAAVVVFLVRWLTGRHAEENLSWRPETQKISAAA